MKIRNDFVTNSSSSSFVICKSDLPDEKREKVINYIENNFNDVTISKLLNDISYLNPELYNLVEYDSDDDEMHIWVRRDESMCDDEIDNILHDYDRSRGWGPEVEDKPIINPKFEYHY